MTGWRRSRLRSARRVSPQVRFPPFSLTVLRERKADTTDAMFLVAIAYVLHKAPFVFPIVGGRKPAQLLANVEALEISLTAEQIAYLDGAKPVDLGFPGSLIVRPFPLSSYPGS